MKKWYEEEYEFTIEVTGFLRSDHTEHYCRNGEEIGEDTPVPMDARSMNRAMGSVLRLCRFYLRICRQCEAVVTLQMSAERTSM